MDGYGTRLGQRMVPLKSAGIYVPGGSAAYPSTVLMCGMAAKAAGVPNVYICTPPGKNGSINKATLAAAEIAGVDRIFRIGGAQAIAALAYSTKSVPAVDVIAGPGNVYVTAAKRAVMGDVRVDMLAGPIPHS
jgi:histidinol dehydrogenase